MVYSLTAKSTIYLQFALQLNRRLRGRSPFLVYDLAAIDSDIESLLQPREVRRVVPIEHDVLARADPR